MAKAAKKSKFVYQKRSRDQLKKRADQSGGNFANIFKDKFSMLKIKEGNVRVRIMPPTWEGADHYGLDIFVHYGVGPDDEAYLCPKEMLNKPCPICEARRAADRAGDEDAAKELNFTKRVALWVINRDKEEEGPLIWSQPWTIDRDVAQLSEDSRTGEILLIDDPEEGYDIEFNRTGSGIKTKYTGLQIARHPSPLCDDEETQEDWLNFISDNPLTECLNFYDYDTIKAALDGDVVKKDSDVDEDEEGEERPRRSARSRVTSRVRDEVEDVVEEEVEEAVDETDEVEDVVEEEDRPARSRSRVRDEEEAGDDAEEDDDRASRTRTRLAGLRSRRRA